MEKIILEYNIKELKEVKIDNKSIENYKKEVESSVPAYIEEERSRHAETAKCIRSILIS
jgi:hypothetical protein